MKRIETRAVALGCLCALQTFGPAALADQGTEGTPSTTTPLPVLAPSPSPAPPAPALPPPPPLAPPALPAATPPPVAPVSLVQSDHDALVGHLGVGYFGVSQLPIAVPPVGPNALPEGGTISAPVIGARYWFQRRLGIDLALGLALSSGSFSANSSSGSQPTSFGFAAHVGLPIALLAISHYVFEVVPETLIGFTTGTLPGSGSNQHVSGFRLDAGARAGAEIHFGFIGIPQLALQGSVGLYFSFQSYGWNQSGNTASVKSETLTTNVGANPWAIFVNNIAALYYF